MGNALLDRMNYREEQSSKKEPMEFPANLNNLEEYNEQFEIRSEVELVEKIACRLDVTEFAVSAAVLYVVLVLVVWMETRKILSVQVRELLG